MKSFQLPQWKALKSQWIHFEEPEGLSSTFSPQPGNFSFSALLYLSVRHSVPSQCCQERKEHHGKLSSTCLFFQRRSFSFPGPMTRLFSTAKTIIGGCRPLETTSSFGCWISCKLGCGCIGCKRNVGALGVCWPCTLASCNVVCMIEVVWWLTSMLMVIPKLQRMNEAMIVPG